MGGYPCVSVSVRVCTRLSPLSMCPIYLQFQAVKVPYPKDTYSEKIDQQEKDFVSATTSECVHWSLGWILSAFVNFTELY